MNKQRIVSNLLMMGVGQAATFVCTLVLFVLISRYLGPTRFGELTLAKAIVMVAWLGVTLGMETLIARTVAREPERASATASAAIIARLCLAVPVLGGVYVCTHIAHLNAETAMATYLYGLAQVLWSLERVLLATFQGLEQMSLNAMWSIGRNVLSLGLVIVVRWQHGGVAAFAATQIPVEIVLFGCTLYWMRSFGRLTWRVSRGQLHEVIHGSLAFWLSEVFFTIYLYVDALLLAGLAGTTAVGLYAPATQMLSVAMFFTVIIGPATLPMLSRLGVGQGPDFRRAAQGTISIYIVTAVPLTIGAVTFAGPVILTVFGPAYNASVAAAMAISLCILPMFLNCQFGQILAASDRQWRWTVALAGCCVANPLLNFLLIPLAQHNWGNAALGAALAWFATEVLEVVYGIILLRSIVLDRGMARILAGALLAGASQGAVLWATPFLWPPVSEAFGVVAFGAVAFLIGTIPRAEIALIANMVIQRFGRGRVRPLMAEAE